MMRLALHGLLVWAVEAQRNCSGLPRTVGDIYHAYGVQDNGLMRLTRPGIARWAAQSRAMEAEGRNISGPPSVPQENVSVSLQLNKARWPTNGHNAGSLPVRSL
jgi:hypothetical protein